jgi:hypothetical protein
MKRILVFVTTMGVVCVLCAISGLNIPRTLGVLPIFAVPIGVLVYFLPEGSKYSQNAYVDIKHMRDRTSEVGKPINNPIPEERLPKKLATPIPERLPTVNLPPPVVESDLTPEILPNFTVSPSPIEHSLLFRVLVQGLFTIALISADLAAGTNYPSSVTLRKVK